MTLSATWCSRGYQGTEPVFYGGFFSEEVKQPKKIEILEGCQRWDEASASCDSHANNTQAPFPFITWLSSPPS